MSNPENTDNKNRRSLFDTRIMSRASIDALVKLHPRTMMRNPVMFVVEVGSVLTSILLVTDRLRHQGHFQFDLQITLWLWFTVLFANFAEAMAEGRGKAQADALRRAKSETTAFVRRNNNFEEIPSSELRAGDVVRVLAGQVIPGDGDVIEGSPRSTNRRSLASPHPSSARLAEIALPSPAEPAYSPTSSRCASHPTPAKPSSIA